MSATVDYAVGRWVTGQKEILVKPPRWKPDSSIPLAVFGHSNLGSALTFAQGAAFVFPKLLAERYGIPSLLTDQDGAPAAAGSAWANDASQANTLSQITGAQTLLGTKTGDGSALWFGTSMGTALGWCMLRNHPLLFRAAVMTLIVASMQWEYDNVPVNAAQIDTAYANGWAAARNTHDISVFAPDLAGIPIWIGETTDDAASPATVDALVAGIGGSAVEVQYFGTGGHDITKIPAAPATAFLMKHSGL